MSYSLAVLFEVKEARGTQQWSVADLGRAADEPAVRGASECCVGSGTQGPAEPSSMWLAVPGTSSLQGILLA